MPKLRLLDFYAAWCPPCQAQAPILEELVRRHPEVEVVKIDIDRNPELADRYDVMAVPTLVLMSDDREVARFVGLTPLEKIEQELQKC